jgi:hypothetical protein
VLNWSPQVSVVLVGATPNADWARLSKRYPGRVFPVGRVPDPAPYFDLADIYIESYPSRATTSALEAALLGLPVVALADIPEDDPAYIFQAGSPGLAGHTVATTADKFAVAVRRLALDPDLRRRQGEDVRAAVLAVHDGAGWRSQMESLYELARALPAADVDDLADSPTDDRYGALLLSASGAPQSPDPRSMVGPIGDLFDRTMESDLLAALFRGLGPTVQVRVAPAWQEQTVWTTRLLALAAARPRLVVSLPFVADDDVRGTNSVACLTVLLAGLGRTTENCGDIRLEAEAPRAAVSLPGELPFTTAILDRLEGLLASPCWEPTQPPVALMEPAAV